MRRWTAVMLSGLGGLFGLGCTQVVLDGDEPSSPHTFSANAYLLSEYRFRGLEQTWGDLALQGGADYAHANGFYAGVWGSNVSGNSYAGGNLELDYYAGYNGKLGELGWTVGGYGYYYPGANNDEQATPGAASQDYNTFELNAGLSWKWIAYKLSYALTDYFGANTRTGYTDDTDGTLYHDLTLNYPLARGFSLGAHIGYTDFEAPYASGVDPDYTDYRLGLTKSFQGGWIVGAAFVDADNDDAYTNVQGLSSTIPDTRDVNGATVVISAGRAF